MDNKLAYVVTGGSRGLGKAVALQAYKKGFPVALIARHNEDLEKAKLDIKNQVPDGSQKITTHVADLTDVDATEAAFLEIKNTHGKVGVLINNAGTWTGGKTIMNLERRDIQHSLDLNFFSAFNATKTTLDLWSENTESELAIINIGATSSLQGWDEVAAFCLAKGALRSFSQSLAREMGPKGVHVCHLIIDGLIYNERTRSLNKNTPENKFIDMNSIARTIFHVATQEKSCWTFELDMRPYNENW
jgi:short-subunit dehydrogenase